MHPAIDSTVPESGTARVKYATYWYQNPPWSTWQDVHSYQNIRMPATVSNPLRADGTRAPSPFFIKRVFVSFPPRSGEMSNWPSPPPAAYSYVKEASAIPVAGELLGKAKDDYIIKFCMGGVARVSVDNRARTSFLDKLASASGKDQVQLGVALGEFRETVDMAIGLARGIRRGITNLARKVEFSGATVDRALSNIERHGFYEAAERFGRKNTSVLERIRDGWLVYQLGLVPLARDLHDGLTWLRAAQAESGGQFPVTVKAGAADETDVWQLMHTKNHQDAPYSLWAKVHQTCGVHYAARYNVPVRATIPEQLGLWNVPSVTWNLVRKTFLVDYVSNTGQWLNGMLAPMNTSFIEGTKSEIRRSTIVDWEFRDETRPWVKRPKLDTHLLVVEHFDRSVLTHGVFPAPLPSVINKLSAAKLANLLSVISQLRHP